MVKTVKPKTLEACLELINEGFYWKFAGGTDLMIRKRQWAGADRRFKKDVVLIGDLKALRGIELVDGYFHIGACTTLTEICDDKRIPDYLREPIFKMASPPIRNLATLGGNICNAAKVADSIPVLFALEAKLVLKSIEGERTLPIDQFILGKYKTALQENEVLYKIIIPNKDITSYSYKKLGTRKGSILSKLSFFGIVKVSDGKLSEFSVSVGALNELPLKVWSIEDRIIGKSIEDLRGIKDEVLNDYKSQMNGATDKRSTKVYREKTAYRFIEMFIDDIVKAKE